MQPKPKNRLQDLALSFTEWVGSIQSVVVHTLIFVASFAAVSLEAIYLAIFIQMSLNLARESLAEVEQDIDELQEDVDEIQEDVGEIQSDVDEIQEDVDEIQEEITEEHKSHDHA